MAQAEIVEDVEVGGCREWEKVVHGWPRDRPRMATGSSTDGHGVVHGWTRVGEAAMYHGTSIWLRGPPPSGCLWIALAGRLRMAHRSSTDGPTGARTGGEPMGFRWGHRAQSARTLLAARGSSTCATAGADGRDGADRASTRSSTTSMAQRQIWSASSRKSASPTFVAASVVEALLVVVGYVQLSYGVRGSQAEAIRAGARGDPTGAHGPDSADARGESTVTFWTCPFVVQRQVAMVLTVQTPLEISQLQILDKVVDMPVVVQQEVPDHKKSGVNSLPNFDSAASVPIEVRCCSSSTNSSTSLSRRRGCSRCVVLVVLVPQVQVVEKTAGNTL